MKEYFLSSNRRVVFYFFVLLPLFFGTVASQKELTLLFAHSYLKIVWSLINWKIKVFVKI